jgi:hypothetical protein
MHHKVFLVITSIANAEHPVLCDYAEKAKKNGVGFIVVGDTKSPKEFRLDGCDFYSIERQKSLDFLLLKNLPERHYARKNIGYLQAIRQGAEVIVETDDDNFARDDFWANREKLVTARLYQNEGWVNVYKLFSDKNIWPRGFSLEHIQKQPKVFLPKEKVLCPIKQGLADENPDVDALYRLVAPLPATFEAGADVALGQRSWCPFNSQNTTWFKEAFPLMYLPSHCSFRMTDIWRSFIAQRICWENGWGVRFHSATVWQERNEHSLMRDFADELPGYLHNNEIVQGLEGLTLKAGADSIACNLRACYGMLVEKNMVDRKELELLDAWLQDLSLIIKQ